MDTWPMIGRDAELALIARATRATGRVGCVAITGALGVGKSRLAREALALFGQATINWATASSAARAIPLGAFVTWLPADVHDPLRATNRVITELVRHARTGRAVVVVDDAHLLDDTSAFMLQQLVDGRLAHVILTANSDVSMSDAVATLLRDERLQRVEVQPLDEAAARNLLETALNGPLDPVSERRMWHLTQGNVRFMRHVVEHEVHAGRLRRDDGIWTWLPGAAVPAPVCELVEHQMGDLPDAVAETVDVLAVAEPLTRRTLVDIVGAGAMEEAEKRSLISVGESVDELVRLSHPMYGEVRRIRAGHIRLRRIRGIVASRLEPTDDPSDVLRRGALLLESDAAVSAEDMLRATEVAIWRGDGALALRFAKAALLAGGGWRASVAYADALAMVGLLHEAQAMLDIDAPPPDAVIPLSTARARILFLQRRSDDALAALHNGQSHSGCSESSAGAVAAMRAFVTACRGDLDAAMHSADAALNCVALQDVSTILATTAKAMVMGELGRVDDLDSTVAAAHSLGGRATATSFLRFLLAEAHCSALQLSGHPAVAENVIDRIREAEQPADVYRWTQMMSGSVSLAAGCVDSAVSQLRDALSSQQPEFLGGWLCRYYVDLAIALAIRGEFEAAKRCLDRIT
ncbi:MAG TPA: AAA family ATPase, partial [Mycobacterium sp.]|nr:AAA family ATPase [Mycobacterium sp.]